MEAKSPSVCRTDEPICAAGASHRIASRRTYFDAHAACTKPTIWGSLDWNARLVLLLLLPLVAVAQTIRHDTVRAERPFQLSIWSNSLLRLSLSLSRAAFAMQEERNRLASQLSSDQQRTLLLPPAACFACTASTDLRICTKLCYQFSFALSVFICCAVSRL